MTAFSAVALTIALIAALQVSGVRQPEERYQDTASSPAVDVSMTAWADPEPRTLFYVVAAEHEAAALRATLGAGSPRSDLVGVEVIVVREGTARSTLKAIEQGLWLSYVSSNVSLVDLRQTAAAHD